MEPLEIPFFPFPCRVNNKRVRGYRFTWPERCNNCDRQCEGLATSHIATCSYGVNYVWFHPEFMVFGFLVRSAAASSAQKKLIRNNPDHVVDAREIEEARSVYIRFAKTFEEDIKKRKTAIVTEYIKTSRYSKDFLEHLVPEIQKSFSYVHDYKQTIARVRQNINVVIEGRYPGADFEEKLDRASPSERAIYWASVLMEEKLKTAFLLLNAEQITSVDEVTLCRLHGLVLKYVRIYNAAFAEKGVAVRVNGESVGLVRGNPIAIAVIPHTLIDNALKYSKRGSEVRVEFHETPDSVEFSVSSDGPRIADDESERIFDIFYRGRSAREQEEEGAGFGLYLAQFIATTMGTRIILSQDAAPNRFGHRTIFSIRFPRER